MSPMRPEQASVLVHHSWYSSRVGTAHARSTGASGAAPARGRAHAARELRRTAEHQNRRINRLQDSTIPPRNGGFYGMYRLASRQPGGIHVSAAPGAQITYPGPPFRCPAMLARIRSAAVLGIDAYPVDVEVDITNGLPSFSTVGLPTAR